MGQGRAPLWTVAERRFLAKHYRIWHAAKIAKYLNRRYHGGSPVRNEKSVRTRASILKITRPTPRDKFTDIFGSSDQAIRETLAEIEEWERQRRSRLEVKTPAVAGITRAMLMAGS